MCGFGGGGHDHQRAHVHADSRSNLETDVDAIDYAAHLVAGVLANRKVAERGLKVGVPQPFLDFSRRCPAVMTVGREVLAKPVQNSFLADRCFGAGDFFPVYTSLALAAVETAIKDDLLEWAQKVIVFRGWNPW